jgi:hypothetical protein
MFHSRGFDPESHFVLGLEMGRDKDAKLGDLPLVNHNNDTSRSNTEKIQSWCRYCSTAEIFHSPG